MPVAALRAALMRMGMAASPSASREECALRFDAMVWHSSPPAPPATAPPTSAPPAVPLAVQEKGHTVLRLVRAIGGVAQEVFGPVPAECVVEVVANAAKHFGVDVVEGWSVDALVPALCVHLSRATSQHVVSVPALLCSASVRWG